MARLEVLVQVLADHLLVADNLDCGASGRDDLGESEREVRAGAVDDDDGATERAGIGQGELDGGADVEDVRLLGAGNAVGAVRAEGGEAVRVPRRPGGADDRIGSRPSTLAGSACVPARTSAPALRARRSRS